MTTHQGRSASIVIPSLPLQLALKKQPRLKQRAQAIPIGTVAEERNDAPLVCINKCAERSRLRAGQKQSVARSILPSLRVVFVDPSEVEIAIQELISELSTFSPRIESISGDAGVFLADPQGMGELYGGLRTWAKSLQAYLRGRGFYSNVVVGFSPRRAIAIAKFKTGLLVLQDKSHEERLLNEVPLHCINLPEPVHHELTLLGIRTVKRFLELPAGELQHRFGACTAEAHAKLTDQACLPIQAISLSPPISTQIPIEPADDDVHRLLFSIKRGLHDVLRETTERRCAIRTLSLELQFEDGTSLSEIISPAEPSRDLGTLLELIRLRLGSSKRPLLDRCTRVENIQITAATDVPQVYQLRLLPDAGSKRPLDAANRAFARLRALYGPAAVVTATPRESHLPEAGFYFEPLHTLPAARPQEPSTPRLIRRLYRHPTVITKPSTSSLEYGPYRIEGGWWVKSVARDYYYARDHSDHRWVYFDRVRHRWILHGYVD